MRRRRDGSGQQRENGWNLVLSYTHSEFPDEIETTPIIAPLWTFFGPLVLGIVSSQELEFHFQASFSYSKERIIFLKKMHQYIMDKQLGGRWALDRRWICLCRCFIESTKAELLNN